MEYFNTLDGIGMLIQGSDFSLFGFIKGDTTCTKATVVKTFPFQIYLE